MKNGWLDKVESSYEEYKTPIKAITGVGLGLVIGMYFYSKFKANKISKVVEAVREVDNGE